MRIDVLNNFDCDDKNKVLEFEQKFNEFISNKNFESALEVQESVAQVYQINYDDVTIKYECEELYPINEYNIYIKIENKEEYVGCLTFDTLDNFKHLFSKKCTFEQAAIAVIRNNVQKNKITAKMYANEIDAKILNIVKDLSIKLRYYDSEKDKRLLDLLYHIAVDEIRYIEALNNLELADF